jgi:hypothetical protein
MAENERARLAHSIADLYATWHGRTEATDVDEMFAKLVMDLVTDYIIRRRSS